MESLKLWQKSTIIGLLEKYHKPIKKSLGQNYLLDYHTLAKIATLTNKIPQSTIIEIGPGLGGLTQVCLAETEHPVIAVELDNYSYHILQEIFFNNSTFPKSWQSRLQLVHADILDYPIPPTTPKPYIFIGNLPYYIATSILIDLIEKYAFLGSLAEGVFAQGIFMVQKEVAERLIATPHHKNHKAYGAISVLLAVQGKVEKVQNLAPIQFYPSPKVNSSVICFTPHVTPLLSSINHYRILKTLVKGVFQYRRKTFSNSIKELFKTASPSTDDSLLAQIPLTVINDIVAPWLHKRAEDITPGEYLEMSANLLNVLPDSERVGGEAG